MTLTWQKAELNNAPFRGLESKLSMFNGWIFILLFGGCKWDLTNREL